MFGTINYIWFYISIGITVASIISILIIFIQVEHYHEVKFFSFLIIPVFLIIMFFLVASIPIAYGMSNQSENNIRTAIRDNYNNAENIVIKSDSGYFSSDNENFSFEMIDNTLIIKNKETVIKYISGDNY